MYKLIVLIQVKILRVKSEIKIFFDQFKEIFKGQFLLEPSLASSFFF